MNNVMRYLINIRSVFVLLSLMSFNLWAVDEFAGIRGEAGLLPTYTTERVVYQRLDERTLNTEVGIIKVPPMVPLVDKRDVDDWYKKQNAKAVFTFKTKSREMLSVEITE